MAAAQARRAAEMCGLRGVIGGGRVGDFKEAGGEGRSEQWRETMAGTESLRGQIDKGGERMTKSSTGTGPAHWYTRIGTLSLTCGPRLPGWLVHLEGTKLQARRLRCT